jgi:hypothetical protein
MRKEGSGSELLGLAWGVRLVDSFQMGNCGGGVYNNERNGEQQL